MDAYLEGLPVTEPDSAVPGGVCALCARDQHRFVHPHSIPGSLWSLMDGCACCETHVAAKGEPWGIPPLGATPAKGSLSEQERMEP